MSATRNILSQFHEVQKFGSRNTKIELLDELHNKHPDELREMLVYVFHPYWNYYIKLDSSKYPLKGTKPITDADWRRFKKILDTLKARKVTGNKARELVVSFLSKHHRAAHWFVQILNRRLKIGVQLKTFEKVFGEELVPRVKCMLAKQWDGKEITEEVALEPKEDGLRMFTIFDKKGIATTVSRNGLPIYNTEHIVKELEPRYRVARLALGTEAVVFDGELKNVNWGAAAGGAHNRSKKVDGNKYVVFDLLTLDEWTKKKCKRKYSQRRFSLAKALNNGKAQKHIELIPCVSGKFKAKQIKTMAQELIEKGWEGIIIKPVNGRYEFKRSMNWLKEKFKRTDEFTVIGATEGKHRLKGVAIGALIVKGKVEGVRVKSEVGQGLSDKDRRRFYKLWKRNELNGLVVEVEHYGVTSSLRMKQNNKPSAIRNGVFIRVRSDKQER